MAGLLQQRNLLAANLGRGAGLLPVLREPRTCGACFQLSNCALLHKVGAAAAAFLISLGLHAHGTLVALAL